MRRVGRYFVLDRIGSGGMGSVYLGKLVGEAGFTRLVAIKTMHGSAEPGDLEMFLDEARLCAQVRHPNVVTMLDIIDNDGELMIVMEYVRGMTLAELTRSGRDIARPPLPIVSAIVGGVLRGLHAAHEAKTAEGAALALVHRDVSPQNVLVGVDGVPRLTDFGIAKAVNRLHTTRDGNIKGKLAYMAPEQLNGERIDRRVDIFSAAVVLWELLAGRRLYRGRTEAEIVQQILVGGVVAPSTIVGPLPRGLDELVLGGVAFSREARPHTAWQMARSLEGLIPPASASDVGDWVESIGGAALAKSAERAHRNDVATIPPSVRPRQRRNTRKMDEAQAPPSERDAPTQRRERKRTVPIVKRLMFGLYPLEPARMLGPLLDTFCRWLTEQLAIEVLRDEVPDYEALADRMKRGVFDFAWLPPIVYLRVGAEAAAPLLATRRGAHGTGYVTALIVREDSKLLGVEDLRGASVAWVDRWSAAGYVLPRVRLRLGGLDPQRLFRTECFYGTHSAAVRAVLEGQADVAATYAATNASGDVVDGAWKEMAGAKMRILMTFGEIPPDLIAVRPSLEETIRAELRAALHEAATSRAMGPIVKGIFGVTDFGPVDAEAYAGLRAALSIDEPER